jgi:hypothetical protein
MLVAVKKIKLLLMVNADAPQTKFYLVENALLQ